MRRTVKMTLQFVGTRLMIHERKLAKNLAITERLRPPPAKRGAAARGRGCFVAYPSRLGASAPGTSG
jgi:hypothetical protein